MTIMAAEENVLENYPSNKEIEDWVSRNHVVNSISPFNYVARAQLMMGEITNEQYIKIEKLYWKFMSEFSGLDNVSRIIIKEIIICSI